MLVSSLSNRGLSGRSSSYCYYYYRAPRPSPPAVVVNGAVRTMPISSHMRVLVVAAVVAAALGLMGDGNIGTMAYLNPTGVSSPMRTRGPRSTFTTTTMNPPSSCAAGSTSTLHPMQRSFASNKIRSNPTTTALWYRALDEQDNEDDPSYVRVKSKAPAFGLYDVKKAVLEQDGPMMPAEEDDKRSAVPGSQPTGAGPRGQRRRRTALNVGLIRALELNQALILTLGAIVFLGKLVLADGFQALGHLDEVLHWAGPSAVPPTSLFQQVLWGVGGAMPLLALSNLIENSDQRAFANVNFSTIVMAMTLFGRRRAPPEEFMPPNFPSPQSFPTTTTVQAAYQSFVLSTVTGLCEETVFRQFLPALIASSTGHVSWALLGQAVLFGLGHSNPKSPTSENAIVVGLQVINGLGFGMLYLLSGGDIVPCILAHALYDFVAFFSTWTSANDQLEYAERMYQEPLSPDQEQQVQQLLKSAASASRGKLDPKLYRAIKRLFYTFDFDKNKTLSLSEVRKGVAYMALERAGVPPPQDQVDQMFLAAVEARRRSGATAAAAATDGAAEARLTFADFLRLYLNMVSRAASQPPVAA